jgi:putative flippase GtrA
MTVTIPPAADSARQRLRYLLVGIGNTAFGYTIGVGALLLLSPRLPTPVIGVLANVLTITMAFWTYRLFVFRSKAPWLPEYLRSFVVYGGSALVSIALIWLLVDGLQLNAWLAQAITVPAIVAISYLGHARFTFARR